MRHTSRRTLAALFTSILLVLGAGLGNPASAEDSSTTWYLALGDSLAAGRGLGAGDIGPGYAGQVLTASRAADPKVRLRNLACFQDETSSSMINGNPSCRYDEGSQFKQALVFLKAHKDDTTLVTLTMGANDVTPCLREADPRPCVEQKLQVLAGNLSYMLGEIRAAAPHARVVVGNFYNPYVVHPTLGPLTTQLQQALNEQVIRPVSTGYGARVADVAGAFHSYDSQAASYICSLTYMCSNGDIHPRPGGYDLISSAFIAQLG